MGVDPKRLYIPPVTRPGRFDGEIVTMVIYRLAVIDARWNAKLKRWTWLRVLKSLLDSEMEPPGPQ